MNYIELTFTLAEPDGYGRDVLIDALAGVGFDTFEETAEGFRAYIPQGVYNPADTEEALSAYTAMFMFEYSTAIIPQKNWNEAWESNFEPIQILDKVFVRATFHQPRPQFPYEIIIDPKMAFGTGHHQTTAMMLELMLENDFTGKNVLDMGCGTGILAIMASKLKAGAVTAIDYDEVCYQSTIENAALNNVQGITALHGGKEAIPNQKFDVILANINRNILLDQMARYAEVIAKSGEIYFSGFYEEPDLEIIKAAASGHGFSYTGHKTKQRWVAARFTFAGFKVSVNIFVYLQRSK